MKKLYLTILLIILSCSTTYEKIQKPVDYSEVIKQAEAIEPELKKSNVKPETKAIIVRATNSLRECQEYSQMAYTKSIELEERLNKLEEENTRLRNKNEALEKELEFYRIIKWGLIVSLIFFILYKTGILQLIFGLAKKAIFPVG